MHSESDSDSDAGLYNKTRPRPFAAKKQHRRLMQTVADPPPTHGEVRFSTRKAAKVSNYNEDDDDIFDDDEDMLPQYQYSTMPGEVVPEVDIVLKHRLREDTGNGRILVAHHPLTNSFIAKEVTDFGRDDFEYFVSGRSLPHSPLLNDLGLIQVDQMERKGPLPCYMGDQRLVDWLSWSS